MDNFLEIVFEFILTFVVIYLIYYFVILRKKKNYDLNLVPVEVNYILIKHRIDIKKINYRKMLLLISFFTSFNMALAITIIFRIVSNVYLGILFSLLIVVPASLIEYNLIGRHFKKNNNRN